MRAALGGVRGLGGDARAAEWGRRLGDARAAHGMCGLRRAGELRRGGVEGG